jgi:signal transduction histidine kinase
MANLAKRPAVWVVSVLLAGVAASFALWNPLEIYERAHVCRTTEQSMESLRADIRSDMQSRLLAQVRVAELWSDHLSFSERERELSCRLFLAHHDGYLALAWVDPGYDVLWAVGRDSRTDPAATGFGTKQGWKPEHVPSLADAGRAFLTPRFRLPDGRTALRVVVPVARAGAVAGFLVAVVDVKDALDSMVDDHKDLGYGVSVLEDATEIYRMPGSTGEYEATLAEQGTLQLPGARWTLRVWPKPDILSRWRSSLPGLAMVLGGLLGSVLMLAILLGWAARRTSRELQRAHDELELRVKERTLELVEVNETLKTEVVDRKRAEDSYRNLSGRLLRLQDEERRRIARDLHDSTAQMLGALAINVDRSMTLAQTGDVTTLERVLGESGHFVEDVTQEIRTMSYLLHPPMLDDLGLEYVLPWYANGFSRRSGIATTLDIPANLGRFPREVELTLFRIVQEALGNVHRHSGSSTVEIALSRTDVEATLDVRDHGTGLPQGVLQAVTGATATAASIGVGIAGMRERVRQLRGRMEVDSGERGTMLRTVLPLTDVGAFEPVSCCGTQCGCPVCGPNSSLLTGNRPLCSADVTSEGSAAA